MAQTVRVEMPRRVAASAGVRRVILESWFISTAEYASSETILRCWGNATYISTKYFAVILLVGSGLWWHHRPRMNVSRKRTTLAILRSLLGPIWGSEKSFSDLTGLSLSWIRKASAGSVPMTQRAAECISEATGISLEWLMNANIKATPIGVDDSLFTMESFEKWAQRRQTKHEETITASPAYPLQQILFSLHAAQKQGKYSTAFFHLRQFSELMRCQFAQDGDRAGAVHYARYLLAEINSLLGKANLHSDEQEELTAEVKYAGEALRKIEI